MTFIICLLSLVMMVLFGCGLGWYSWLDNYGGLSNHKYDVLVFVVDY